MEIRTIGIDIAKNVFQVHGADGHGRCVLKKKVSRKALKLFIANTPPCTIVMESSGGANFWAREFKDLGHEVKLIAPKLVKPFVKTNKNDQSDAEAIVEAASRPQMRFVSPKSLWQQEIQTLHTCRSILLRIRIAIGNAIMGLLHEFGVVMPKGRRQFLKNVHSALDCEAEVIPAQAKFAIFQLVDQWSTLQEEVNELDSSLERISKQNEQCKRILKIEGVGCLTATAAVAVMGDPHQFQNGRQFSAFLGLVPR